MRGASTRSPDLEIGPPTAVDAEPAHREIAARDLQVERPRLELRDFDHLVGVAARRSGPSIAARDAAALALPSVNRPSSSRRLPLIVPPLAARPDRIGPVTVGGDVVAVEQPRLGCIELQVDRRPSAGEIDRRRCPRSCRRPASAR